MDFEFFQPNTFIKNEPLFDRCLPVFKLLLNTVLDLVLDLVLKDL